jgi:lysophospholipase L1-like esterase
VPKRVIVLGDSITACNVVGGKMSADCVSKKLFDYVKGSYAPDAVYENYAVGGATMSGLAAQIDQIPSGPGHALVVVYIGGNDLSPYIFMSDAAAMGAYDGIAQRTVDTWANLFNELADTQRFPDGATVLMNNQYNPFDDCTASPYNLSAVKINILHMYNAILQDIANEAFEKALIVDQFTPYLGHGHHYDVQTCPHYTPGATPFMKDLIHANPAGNEALAKVLSAGADVLYRDCL